MPDQSTTPGLVPLLKRLSDAIGRRDPDAITALYAPDGVWDLSPVGMGTFEGHAAIRGFMEDWFNAYEEWEREAEELLDLGNGVAFAVWLQKGRPAGSSAEAHLRYAAILLCDEGKFARVTNYTDIDEARAAAERLAQERAEAMSREKVEIVKRLMDAFNRRDIDRMADVTTSDFEWFPVFAARVEGDVYRGRAGIETFLGEVYETWEEFRPLPEEYRDLGDCVLALGRLRTRGRVSGVPVDSPWAGVYVLRGDRVSRVRTFLDHGEASRAAGLQG